ncbi:hypothetical protein [Flavobacterium sp.]|jgi:hypothetical protein|uniref:hypothetical protein n=1 Tax=Flavobacterium sp. TaxID=239 RepID=UPI0037C14843
MDYYTEIKVCIKEIGQAKIEFQTNTKDYTFNGKPPRDIPQDRYTKLNELFESYLSNYIRQNCKVEDINKLITITKETIQQLKLSGDNHRVNFLLSRSKNELSETATFNHDDINSIISTQKLVLSKILNHLYEKIDYLNSNIDNELIADIDNEDLSSSETDTSDIPFKHIGRATFKLNKKESLMLLYILEQEHLLEFESIEHRRLFIESNFNFTETRNNVNQGNPFPMKGISSELSDFSSYTERASNNKTLEKLLKKLNETIHLFEFKK